MNLSTRTLALFAAAAACGTTASAQGASGSEGTLAIAQATMSSGGTAAAVLHHLEADLGQAAAGRSMGSESFELRAGVAWTEGFFDSDAPVVFGVHPARGSKEGGQPVTVFGFNFDQAAAGAPEVRIGDAVASNAFVTGATTITAQTPAGVDLFGNPLGAVPVEVSNALGDAGADGSFVYSPAVLQLSHARLGAPFELTLSMEPGSMYFLAFGRTVAGQSVAFGPFDGALLITSKLVLFDTGFLAGTDTRKLRFDVPDDASLAGLDVDFQALGITDAFAPQGSFSNLHTVTLQP